MHLLYTLLDYFFLYFHLILTLFNLLGWTARKTRRIHLGVIALTAISWFGLGIWYGIGYCPLTDWHWAVRRELGYAEMPRSYLTFIIEYFSGIKLPGALVEKTAFYTFFVLLFLSISLNLRDYLKNR